MTDLFNTTPRHTLDTLQDFLSRSKEGYKFRIYGHSDTWKLHTKGADLYLIKSDLNQIITLHKNNSNGSNN